MCYIEGMTNTQTAVPTLETLLKEFIAKSAARYDTHAYPAGYMMSMLLYIAKDDALVAGRLVHNLTIELERYN